MDTAIHHLETHYKGLLVHITVEYHDACERTTRELIRKVKSDLALMQGRAGYPKLYVEILEGAFSVHSHIIALIPFSLAKRLQGYSYSSHISVGWVHDVYGLRNYLLKEMTPQAAYGSGIRRNKGSHPLGKGGGDRCRLSKALESALAEGGQLPADTSRKRAYASRSLASSAYKARNGDDSEADSGTGIESV